jgi:hypothetical protein
MRSIALAIVVAPNKGLRTIRWPQFPVIEHSSVPHGLISDLGRAYGVRGRARTSVLETAFHSVVHVILVVWTVKVLPIPTCREVVDRHDTSWTWLFRKVVGLAPSCHHVSEAGVA